MKFNELLLLLFMVSVILSCESKENSIEYHIYEFEYAADDSYNRMMDDLYLDSILKENL